MKLATVNEIIKKLEFFKDQHGDKDLVITFEDEDCHETTVPLSGVACVCMGATTRINLEADQKMFIGMKKRALKNNLDIEKKRQEYNLNGNCEQHIYQRNSNMYLECIVCGLVNV